MAIDLAQSASDRYEQIEQALGIDIERAARLVIDLGRRDLTIESVCFQRRSVQLRPRFMRTTIYFSDEMIRDASIDEIARVAWKLASNNEYLPLIRSTGMSAARVR